MTAISPDVTASRYSTVSIMFHWATVLLIAAALYHHYLRRDTTLLRMLPGRDDQR